MTINTVRFGDVEIDEKKILSFKDGLPGLEEYRRFAILQFEDSYPIIWLQSAENPEICLPVIDSFLVLPDYAFDMSDTDVRELGLTGPEDIHVVSVIVIPENIEQMTANLAAPIVINVRSGSARQIIIGGEYNVRFPVFAEICRLIKEDEGHAGALAENQ